MTGQPGSVSPWGGSGRAIPAGPSRCPAEPISCFHQAVPRLRTRGHTRPGKTAERLEHEDQIKHCDRTVCVARCQIDLFDRRSRRITLERLDDRYRVVDVDDSVRRRPSAVLEHAHDVTPNRGHNHARCRQESTALSLNVVDTARCNQRSSHNHCSPIDGQPKNRGIDQISSCIDILRDTRPIR